MARRPAKCPVKNEPAGGEHAAACSSSTCAPFAGNAPASLLASPRTQRGQVSPGPLGRASQNLPAGWGQSGRVSGASRGPRLLRAALAARLFSLLLVRVGLRGGGHARTCRRQLRHGRRELGLQVFDGDRINIVEVDVDQRLRGNDAHVGSGPARREPAPWGEAGEGGESSWRCWFAKNGGGAPAARP